MMKLHVLLALCVCLLPSIALASPSVYFNGIDVTGVSGQRFTNVTVEFDSTGNVIITGPQYHLADITPKAETPSVPVAPGNVVSSQTQPVDPVHPTADPVQAPAAVKSAEIDRLPNQYQPTYLVGEFNYPGLLGYNIDIYINGKFIKTMNQGQAHASVDISSYLVTGKNVIQYRTNRTADSGSSSQATVDLSLAKVTGREGNAVELSGKYARVLIKGADGENVYTVEFLVP